MKRHEEIKKGIRLALRPFNLDIVDRQAMDRHERLLGLLADCDTIRRFPHGYFQRGGDGDGTLWTTHCAGLFSCLTTVMWTVMEITRAGERCYDVNNALGMQWFKESPWNDTWHDLFLRRERAEIDSLMNGQPRRPEHFNHHGDYQEIVREHLGTGWAENFLRAYLTPAPEVRKTADMFMAKYRISSTPTIAVYYRGTDKYKEVKPAPVTVYFEIVDSLLASQPGAEILIQTDQAQVREQFARKYGQACKYIAELPVTRGSRAIHDVRRLCGNRDLFARNLYAMCLAIAGCHTLVTHTGNVSFFLALHALLAGKQVIQVHGES
ncbi:MAG: hypothetical protein ACKV2V_09985 [Blastocatellia bacterium]